MSIKFIDIAAMRLAYLEKNPQQEQIVFFIHGNSSSHRTWQNQLNNGLFDNYRLIAFDLPGCGQSLIGNKPEWDYSPISTGKIIAEAIKQLSAGKPYCIVGFSYGSNVVGETLNYGLVPKGISLLSSCVIGDYCGLDKVFVPGDNIFFHDEINKEIVQNFFSDILLTKNENDVGKYTEDFFQARRPFRSALIQSVLTGKVSDEIAFVEKQEIPIQIIFGQADRLLQIDYLDNAPLNIWRNTIYKLPGAGHYLQNDQPESFNKLLAEYLEERFKEGRV